MESTEQHGAVRHAFYIGFITIAAYIVNYFMRNMLSVFTPVMIQNDFNITQIGIISSVYMVVYAAGQLLNGFLGDYLSPKHMAFLGVLFSGMISVVFSLLHNFSWQIVCFAVLGYALSMVRGPFMKIISENTLSKHARLICVFFSASSFFGPLIASIFALLFSDWRTAFAVAGAVSVLMSFFVLFFLSLLEKKGRLIYRSTKGSGLKGILSVFQIEGFCVLILISGVNEICATSITFWIPTYLTNQLHFEKEVANFLFSVLSIMRAMVPFFTLWLFKITKEKDNAIMRVSFIIIIWLFSLMSFFSYSRIGIALFIPALLCASCISALLWSIYIPSLGRTGHVSSANGVLDCSGYIAAAGSNLIVSLMLKHAGWNMVFLFWAAIMLLGFILTFMRKQKKCCA